MATARRVLLLLVRGGVPGQHLLREAAMLALVLVDCAIWGFEPLQDGRNMAGVVLMDYRERLRL